MVPGAEGHRVPRWMLRVTGGSGTTRDRVVGESSTSGPRWDNEPATGIFRSPTGLATADPRCAWALATRRSFRWRPAPCSTRRPGRPPEVSLSASAGLRMASSGPMATPRTRTAMTMTTRTSTGSFFSTVVHHAGGCAASASTVPLEFGVLGHIERDGCLPRAGANTPDDAGLTRCARLWPGAVQPSRFVRPQPVYPATGRRATSGGPARSGPGPCPAMLHYSEV